MSKLTRSWHIGDVILCAYAARKTPSGMNTLRVAWAIIGLAGNIVITYQQKRQNRLHF